MRGEGDKRKEKELRERGVSEREEQVCKRGSRREGVREEEGGRVKDGKERSPITSFRSLGQITPDRKSVV